MTTFIHTFRCRACGERFELRRHSEAVPKHPRCPRKACQSAKVRESFMPDQGLDVAAGKAPTIGGSVNVRALDMSLKIAAEDAGLTDLNTSARYGESMAPKLPPRLQAQADGFFGGGRIATPGKRRVQVDLRGALGALAQGPQVQPAAGGGAVDIGSFLPKGRQGSSAVPSHKVIAG
jgi:hypothetical protein